MTDRPVDRFATLDAPASWQAVDFMSDLHLHAAIAAEVARGDRYWLLWLRFGDSSDNRSPPTHNCHFDLINNNNVNDKHVYKYNCKYNYNASSY